MIPDDVEKIIMTKEDYDRNVEQLLYDKINAEQEVERLNNIISELERYINEEYIYDELGMKIFDASKLQDKLQELKGNNNGVWVNNLLEVIKENNIEFGSEKE